MSIIINDIKLFKERKAKDTPTGDIERNSYKCVIGKNGSQKIIKNEKKIPWYAYIQSHKNSCDINVILTRYKNGELDLIKPVKDSQFFDAVGLPETLIEMRNKLNEGIELFNALPVEVKQKFDNSFDKWLLAGGIIPQVDSTKTEPIETEPTIVNKGDKKDE